MSDHALEPQNYETYMLIQDGVAWFKSQATIRMTQGLGFPWSLAAILRVVPSRWLDRLYGLVARNRFRLFGARTSCYAPDSRHADRFLR